MSENCVFCRIAKKEIPSEIVFEDDRAVVFKDINPQAPIHLLVVPKKHVTAYEDGFSAYDPELLSSLFYAAEEAAIIVGVDKSGFRLIINCGPDSGQEIAHLHMHLLGGRKLGRLVGEED
jgi:histidine triad (HIT) family protein